MADNKIYKDNNQILTIQAETKSILNTKVEFFSFDSDTARFIFKLQKDQQPLPISTAAKIFVVLKFTVNGIEKKRILDSTVDEELTVQDSTEGTISLVIPSEYRGYVGMVTGGVYVQFDNGQSLDCGYFRFTMKKSMIDETLEDMSDFYVSTFESLHEQILTQSSETQELLDTITTEVAALEENYAPQLNTLTAQLADTKQEITNLPTKYIAGKTNRPNVQTDGLSQTFGHETNAIASDVSTSVIIGGGSTNYNNVIGGDGANVNTVTPNTVTSGTNAHVSVVGGYDNSAGSLSSKIISDHSKTEIGGAGHNAIYGGANHIIKSTASFATIAGGQNNTVSGQAGFATGQRNTVGGTGSAAFGYDNVVSANGVFAAGAALTVSGLFAQAYGSTNTAAANFSRADGNYSHARTVGQQASATGRFAALGDAQTSVIEMYKTTSNAITTTLGMLQSTTSHLLLPNQSVAFTVLLVARDTAGTDSAAWEIKGLARRGATGSTTYVGTPTVTSLGADTGAATWTAAMSGDSAGGLNVRITGQDAKTIRWVQRLTLVEVMV